MDSARWPSRVSSTPLLQLPGARKELGTAVAPVLQGFERMKNVFEDLPTCTSPLYFQAFQRPCLLPTLPGARSIAPRASSGSSHAAPTSAQRATSTARLPPSIPGCRRRRSGRRGHWQGMFGPFSAIFLPISGLSQLPDPTCRMRWPAAWRSRPPPATSFDRLPASTLDLWGRNEPRADVEQRSPSFPQPALSFTHRSAIQDTGSPQRIRGPAGPKRRSRWSKGGALGAFHQAEAQNLIGKERLQASLNPVMTSSTPLG